MMKHTTLLLLDPTANHVAFYGDVQKAVTDNRERYNSRAYVMLDGNFANDESVCEELFDLTNNPNRQTERVALYGNGRSVSVGDMVGVETNDGGMTFYVCAPCGWVEVTS